MRSEAEITLTPWQLWRLSEELGISAHSIAEALLRISKTSPLSAQFDRLAVLCNAQAMDIMVLEAKNTELESQVNKMREAFEAVVYHGCFTGDCPHDSQHECDSSLNVVREIAIKSLGPKQ